MRIDKEPFTTIDVRKIDKARLEKLKIHPKQPMWEVIKNLLKAPSNTQEENTI